MNENQTNLENTNQENKENKNEILFSKSEAKKIYFKLFFIEDKISKSKEISSKIKKEYIKDIQELQKEFTSKFNMRISSKEKETALVMKDLLA